MQGCNKPWNADTERGDPACSTCNVLFEAELRMIRNCIFCPGLRLQCHTCYPFSLIATQGHWWTLQGGRGVADNTARTLTLNSYSYYDYWKDRQNTYRNSALIKHGWLAQAELRQGWVSVGQTGENALNCLKIFLKTSELSYHSHVANQDIDWHPARCGWPESVSSLLWSAGKFVPYSLVKINPCLGQIQI